VEVYAPNPAGSLVLNDTWSIETNRYNAVTVDARTGTKWFAGDGGQVISYLGVLKVLGGSPNLLSAAAFGNHVYVSTASTIYWINYNINNSPVVSSATAGGPGLAALSNGVIVQPSSAAAAFAIRAWAPDLSASVLYTRNDTGNAWTPLAIASAANLVHVGCSDGRVRTYALDGTTATLVWTSTGTPGATGYPTATSLLGVSAVLSSKAAMIDAQLTVRSVVQAIVMT